VQPPVPTHHQRTFVDLSNSNAGLALFNRGLPEYEVRRDGPLNTIALTLLRCVDRLFRDDLLTRPGYAWLPVDTPDAQCPGSHTFSYALAPHVGNWHNIYATAQTWAAPVIVRRGDETEGFVPLQAVPKERQEFQMFKTTRVLPVDRTGNLPSVQSFVQVTPAQVVLSAVKRSEEGELLVVRVFNVGEEAVSAAITLFLPVINAYELSLAEERLAPLPTTSAGVQVMLRPKQIMTVGFSVQRADPKPPRRLG
jgi:alpha-mannosidase